MSYQQKKDQVFREENRGHQPFEFDAQVAEAFDDMASRSIPGYQESLRTAIWIVQHHLEQTFEQGIIYDLGASTGAFESAIVDLSSAKRWEIIAIDSSEEMMNQAKGRLHAHPLGDHIEWRAERAQDTQLDPAVMVISHYCIQFVEPQDRQALVARIYDQLKPHGFFVLSEKVQPTASEARYFQDRYDTFKRAAGYSDQEILNKRTALQDVLIPWTVAENEAMMRQAGFDAPVLMHKNWNFCTWIAQKLPSGVL